MGPVSTVKLSQPEASPAPPKPDIADAAEQFEALLLCFLLRSVSEAGAGLTSGAGEDSANASALRFAEEHLATALASQGGLGMARLVAAGLSPAADSNAAPAQNASAP
jgi:Rod binding domain-containing protein